MTVMATVRNNDFDQRRAEQKRPFFTCPMTQTTERN